MVRYEVVVRGTAYVSWEDDAEVIAELELPNGDIVECEEIDLLSPGEDAIDFKYTTYLEFEEEVDEERIEEIIEEQLSNMEFRIYVAGREIVSTSIDDIEFEIESIKRID